MELMKKFDNYRRILAFVFLFGTLSLMSTLGFSKDKKADELVPHNVINLGSGPYYSNHIIVVDKSERSVAVWEQDPTNMSYRKIRNYEADFGKTSGDKLFRGDHKTPEGVYLFTGMLESAMLDFQEYGTHEVRAFPMNYPNLFDRRKRKTGSGIWLHAVPDTAPLTRGSRGCVVLKKDDLNDIGNFIKPQNTPIIVNDTVTYLSPKEIQAQKEAVISYLKKWLESWQTKDFEQYMSFYSSEFRSRGMNYADWHNYKKGLATERAEIFVSISEPRIVRYKNDWTVQFFQKYRSDAYEDFGHKTLYLHGDLGNLKIIAEEFDMTKNTTAIAQFDFRNFSCCEKRTLTNN